MIRFALTPGSAKAANGIQRIIALALSLGVPYTPGAALTLTIGIDEGTGSGAAAINGLSNSLTVTLDGGAASGT